MTTSTLTQTRAAEGLDKLLARNKALWEVDTLAWGNTLMEKVAQTEKQRLAARLASLVTHDVLPSLVWKRVQDHVHLIMGGCVWAPVMNGKKKKITFLQQGRPTAPPAPAKGKKKAPESKVPSHVLTWAGVREALQNYPHRSHPWVDWVFPLPPPPVEAGGAGDENKEPEWYRELQNTWQEFPKDADFTREELALLMEHIKQAKSAMDSGDYPLDVEGGEEWSQFEEAEDLIARCEAYTRWDRILARADEKGEEAHEHQNIRYLSLASEPSLANWSWADIEEWEDEVDTNFPSVTRDRPGPLYETEIKEGLEFLHTALRETQGNAVPAGPTRERLYRSAEALLTFAFPFWSDEIERIGGELQKADEDQEQEEIMAGMDDIMDTAERALALILSYRRRSPQQAQDLLEEVKTDLQRLRARIYPTTDPTIWRRLDFLWKRLQEEEEALGLRVSPDLHV